jgi:tetratricopeptide (TPR) repeat protein
VHPLTAVALHNLAESYRALGRLDEVLPLYEQTLEAMRTHRGPDHPDTLGTTGQLAENYLSLSRFVDAEQLLSAVLPGLEERYGDEWTTFQLGSLHGAALAGLNRRADAESALLRGYEGLVAQRESLPLTLRDRYPREAARRLVALYEAWDKPDDAAAWRRELAKYGPSPPAETEP